MKWKVAFAGIIWTVLGGCSLGDERNPRVFRYNESANLTSLDPAQARSLEPMWVTDQIFDGLVELTSELKVAPLIAQSFEVDSSGTIWEFVLRDDVFFPRTPGIPGLEKDRRLVAEDVVFSLERLRDLDVASSGQWILESVDSDAPFGGIQAIGIDTVVITLKSPFPPFLGLLTTSYANIVAPEAVRHFGVDFRSHPVGTGPFRLAWWVEDVACVLHRNPSYWEKDSSGQSLPYLEAVHIDFALDMGAEYQGLLQGRYDFMSGLHAAYMEELLDDSGQLRPEHQGTIRLEKVPFLKTDYIGLFLGEVNDENNWNPTQDSRIRRAMSWAIDRKGLARHLRRGAVVPTDHFVPPGLLGLQHKREEPVRRLSEARLLVDSVKADHTESWSSLLLSTTSDYTDLCAALQFQWKEIGLDVEIEVLSATVHRERVAQGDAMMFRKSWLADYADAENFLALFASGNFAPGGPNYTHFSSPGYDAVFQRAMKERNPDQRDALHLELDAMVADELPVIPLFHDQVTHFIRHEISGWSISPTNRLDLRRVRKRD